MESPPRMEVAMEVWRPVVAAATPVVKAPRMTWAAMATLRAQPVAFAKGQRFVRRVGRRKMKTYMFSGLLGERFWRASVWVLVDFPRFPGEEA